MIVVDGIWSDWSIDKLCQQTAQLGQTYRTRSCDSPAAAFGGTECVGETKDYNKGSNSNCPGGS